MVRERIKTKYGAINIIEDDNGAIEVRYDTQDNVLIETKSTNSIVFHILKPRTNRVETIKNISDLECCGGEGV